MENKIIWIGLTLLIFFLAGFLFSTNDYIVLLIFSPGLIATTISQTFFGTDGGESLFVIPEVLIVTLIFWLILPWIFLILSKRTKSIDNRNSILISALAISFWSIGFALNPDLSKILITLNNSVYFSNPHP